MPTPHNVKQNRKAAAANLLAERKGEFFSRKVAESRSTALQRIRKGLMAQGDSLIAHTTLIHEAKLAVGNLALKKVLVLADVEELAKYLKEKEGANTVLYNGLVQLIDKRLPQRNFHLILANQVFEHHAFTYLVGGIKGSAANASAPGLRKERAQILKKLRAKLSPGGTIVLTGFSSKTIFTPKEITQAGLRIVKLNVRNRERQYITVLQKPFQAK